MLFNPLLSQTRFDAFAPKPNYEHDKEKNKQWKKENITVRHSRSHDTPRKIKQQITNNHFISYYLNRKTKSPSSS